MAAKEPLVPFDAYDLDKVIADLETIRKYNPQRHEMELLTAIVFESRDPYLCVGYKDTSADDFWTRGHMPDMPLMPGVLMCEAAAQLAGYYTQRWNLLEAEMLGFGGMDDVRFREIVRPGDRFVIQSRLLKVRPRAMIQCEFHGYVDKTLVVEGKIRGIPLPLSLLREQTG